MKKRIPEINLFHYWGQTLIVFLILGVIFVNSLYKSGYDTTWVPYYTGELVLGSSGYEAEENRFTYTGDTDSYVCIAGVRPSDQLLFFFGEEAQADADITVRYVDTEDNLTEDVSVGKWEKGMAYAIVDIVSDTYRSYQIGIRADFTLRNVYYASVNSYTREREIKLYIVASLIAVFVSVLLMLLKGTRKLVIRLSDAVGRTCMRIAANRKKLLLGAAACVALYPAALAATYALSAAGVGTFSVKASVFVYLLFLIAAVIICYCRSSSKKIEVLAFCVILLIGSTISFFEPSNLGLSWDDEAHYPNALHLSHMFEKKVSIADFVIVEDQPTVATYKLNYDRQKQENYNAMLDAMEPYYCYFDELPALNGAVAYLPSAIGLSLARGLGFPYHITLKIGRWMNVWLLAALVYFSMKKLKTGKSVVLLLALLPTNIFMAANYSYDIWLTGLSMYGLSTFFGHWQQPEKKVGYVDMLQIGGSLLLAVLPKLIYFPLILIALFMPSKKFNSKKQCRIYRAFILLATALPFLMAFMQNIVGDNLGTGDTRGSEGVNAGLQLALFFQDPWTVIGTIFRHLKDYLNPWKNGDGYITYMAFLGNTGISYKVLLVTVVICVLADREEREPKFPWWTKLGVIAEYVAIGFIVSFSMYIAFTPAGADYVAGCQPRYIIPALFPLLYVLTRFSGKTVIKNRIGETVLNVAPVALLTAATALEFWNCCLSLY